MSALALIGGVAIYANRDELLTFNRQFDHHDAKDVFARIVKSVTNFSDALMNRIETGSLQRYIAALLGLTIIFVLPELYQIAQLDGGREQLPVNLVSIVGAIIVVLAAIGIAAFHHQRLTSLRMLSVVGLMVSLLVIYFSSPDLSMAQ